MIEWMNYYGFREDVGFVPAKRECGDYEVKISKDDKIIEITEDGSLKATVQLDYDSKSGTLYLVGKDGKPFADVKLPITIKSIELGGYDHQTHTIKLIVTSTDGTVVDFDLDVADLVYYAGNGINISEDNEISIKLDEDSSNNLVLSEDGLSIDLSDYATLSGLTELETKHDQEFEALTQSLNEITSALTEVDSAIDDEILSRIEGDEFLQNQINMISGISVSGVTEELMELSAKTEELSDSVLLINETISAITDSVTNIENQIDDLDEHVDALGTELADLSNEVTSAFTSVQSDIDDLDERVDNLEDNVDDIEGNIETLEGAISSAQTELDDLKEIVSHISGTSGDVQDQIDALAERVESGETAFNNLCEELNIEFDNINSELSEVDAKIKTSEDNVKQYTDGVIDTIKIVSDETDKRYYLEIDGSKKGAYINIPKDKYIKKVEFSAETSSLVFHYVTAESDDEIVSVSLADIKTSLEAGDGIDISENAINIMYDESSYITLNDKNQIDVDFACEKGDNWVFSILDKNGNVADNKTISFADEVASLKNEIADTYATPQDVENGDIQVKGEVIGKETDTEDANTIYGVRALVSQVQGSLESEIEDVNTTIESVSGTLKSNMETILDDAKEYADKQDENTILTVSANTIAQLAEYRQKELEPVFNNLSAAIISASSDATHAIEKVHTLSNGMNEDESIVEYVTRAMASLVATVGQNSAKIQSLLESVEDLNERVTKLENKV